MLVGSFTNAPAAASCLNPRPGIAACSAHTATCHVLRCRKRAQATSSPTAVGDRYVSKSAAPPATDWTGSVRTYARVWGFPIAIIVIQSMRKAKSSNPLFLWGGVDKMGADFRVDPSSTLLEVLDP